MNSPRERRSWLRSTNPLERPNGEITRRANVEGIVATDADIRWLVVEVRAEQTDGWPPGWVNYMSQSSPPTKGDHRLLEPLRMATEAAQPTSGFRSANPLSHHLQGTTTRAHNPADPTLSPGSLACDCREVPIGGGASRSNLNSDLRARSQPVTNAAPFPAGDASPDRG